MHSTYAGLYSYLNSCLSLIDPPRSTKTAWLHLDRQPSGPSVSPFIVDVLPLNGLP